MRFRETFLYTVSLLALLLVSQAPMASSQWSSQAPSQTYTVTNLADSGAGSLRQAILDANANPGLDTIAFNLAGGGTQFVTLNAVANVTDPVIIDGTTQPGFAGVPLITVKPIGTGAQALNITAGGSTIKGLAFYAYVGSTNGMVAISGAGNNVVTGCFFGFTGPDFSRGVVTTSTGLVIDGSNNNRIGGSTAADRNYFATNSGGQLIIRGGGAGNIIVGNRFGTVPTGGPLASQGDMIRIESSPNNTIGGSVGTTPGGACSGECNSIGGTTNANGVVITGSASTGNHVIGSYIGLLPTGSATQANSTDGVRLDNAPANFVGGSSEAERNLITGNTQSGIRVTGAAAIGNNITGNYVGLYTDGVSAPAPASSSLTGIWLIVSSTQTHIGGTSSGARNIISANRDNITIQDGGSDVVQGNFIGTTADGMAKSTTLGNGINVFANNNTIGGTAGTVLGGACSGACNLISGNGQDGASHGIQLGSASGNTIDGNYIGMNATGTSALFNGQTPNGQTFNGKAIRIANNSNNNTIGRDLSADMIADIKNRSSLSPDITFCMEDDFSKSFIIIERNDGSYVFHDCPTGRTYGGFIDERVFDTDNDIENFALISNPMVEGKVRGVIGTLRLDAFTFPSTVDRYILNDKNVTDNVCNCGGRFAIQTSVGAIAIEGSSGNQVKGNALGVTATLHAPITGTGLAPVTIANLTTIASNNNSLINNFIWAELTKNTVNITTSGTGNTVSNAILINSLGVNPIAANQTSVLDRLKFSVDAFNNLHITGAVHGAAPDAVLKIDIYDGHPFLDGNNNILQRLTESGLQLNTQANSAGDASFDFLLSFLEANFLYENRLAAATSTEVATGSTSAMSIPVAIPHGPYDFDGDGRTDPSVYRRGAGPGDPSTWYVLKSGSNSVSAVSFGDFLDTITADAYRLPQLTNYAVFRPNGSVANPASTGTWYIAKNTDTPAQEFDAVQFGLSTDTAVPGDYDGDGRAEPALFRGGTWYSFSTLSAQTTAFQFGLANDKPVPADYNGDGRLNYGIYRSGLWVTTACGGCSVVYNQFGLDTDIPVPADYDGDGKADLGVFRPATGVWYLLQSTAGFTAYQFGINGDVPLNGDFDGDGKADQAVWRPTDGNFYILQSSDLSPRAVHWGQNGDVPVSKFQNAIVP